MNAFIDSGTDLMFSLRIIDRKEFVIFRQISLEEFSVSIKADQSVDYVHLTLPKEISNFSSSNIMNTSLK